MSTGKYAFALKIPEDFSANLVSPGSFDAASQAMLNVTTNDANNYLLSTIVDKLTTAVHTTVATEVGEETANQLLTGFGTIHSQMLKASDGAGQLADGVASLHDGAVTLHEGTTNSAPAQPTSTPASSNSATAPTRSARARPSSAAGWPAQDKTASLPADSQSSPTAPRRWPPETPRSIPSCRASPDSQRTQLTRGCGPGGGVQQQAHGRRGHHPGPGGQDPGRL